LDHWADVAAVVNDRMAAKGLSQRDLAERSGVSPATLRKIQHGDAQARNRSTLTGLSRALGFPEDHLWRVAMNGKAAVTVPDDDAGTLRDQVADLERRVGAIETQLQMHEDDGAASGKRAARAGKGGV
jgi:transcriptional regulator with XRE-family HTH domain